jgi:hypothetical protein
VARLNVGATSSVRSSEVVETANERTGGDQHVVMEVGGTGQCPESGIAYGVVPQVEECEVRKVRASGKCPCACRTDSVALQVEFPHATHTRAFGDFNRASAGQTDIHQDQIPELWE